MQYKNPIDIELVAASCEAYEVLVRILEYIGASPDTGVALRLKNALHPAKTQMQVEEEVAREDFSNVETMPVSMD